MLRLKKYFEFREYEVLIVSKGWSYDSDKLPILCVDWGPKSGFGYSTKNDEVRKSEEQIGCMSVLGLVTTCVAGTGVIWLFAQLIN